jgi:hypothetical protein
MARTNGSALSGVTNYGGKADRADQQKKAMAEDRRTAGRTAGRGRRSV